MGLLTFWIVAATYSATRLIVWDTWPPAAWFRDRIRARWGRDSWQDELVRCPWCMSTWVAAVIVAGTAATVGLRYPVLVWLGARALVGLVALNLDAAPPDPDDED